jgi:hypothetical protein
VATTTKTAPPAEDEAHQIFYYGTSVDSGLALLNGAPLSVDRAEENKLDGPPGFFLATDARDAEYFAARRDPGTVLQYLITIDAVATLTAGGAILRPIPQGDFPTEFNGAEFVIPPSLYSTFDSMRASGQIVVTPYFFSSE